MTKPVERLDRCGSLALGRGESDQQTRSVPTELSPSQSAARGIDDATHVPSEYHSIARSDGNRELLLHRHGLSRRQRVRQISHEKVSDDADAQLDRCWSVPRRQLDENETRKYIRQIVSAVDHMHRAHVIHRDIKLQNFMLDQNNDIVIIGRTRIRAASNSSDLLIDFGLSNSLDEKGFLTTQCGSPA